MLGGVWWERVEGERSRFLRLRFGLGTGLTSLGGWERVGGGGGGGDEGCEGIVERVLKDH